MFHRKKSEKSYHGNIEVIPLREISYLNINRCIFGATFTYKN